MIAEAGAALADEHPDAALAVETLRIDFTWSSH